MTFNAADDGNRDYVNLEEGGDGGGACCQAYASTSGCCGTADDGDLGDGGGRWWWAKLLLVLMLVGVLGAVFLKWIGPFFMEKGVIPMIIWERETFSITAAALVVIGALAILPCLLLPSTPFMWVAGMTFGYGYGYLMITGGVTIGVSLPYFIGSLFYQRIHGWLERYPKHTSIIKLAGEGDWFNQLRAVALIRISPFPYVIYNYCAAATDVEYCPYLLGTLAGMVPEIFAAIYTGILIETLADASHGKPSLSPGQIVFNVAGFCTTVATTVIVTIYAKRRLKNLQMQEEEDLLLPSSKTDLKAYNDTTEDDGELHAS